MRCCDVLSSNCTLNSVSQHVFHKLLTFNFYKCHVFSIILPNSVFFTDPLQLQIQAGVKLLYPSPKSGCSFISHIRMDDICLKIQQCVKQKVCRNAFTPLMLFKVMKMIKYVERHPELFCKVILIGISCLFFIQIDIGEYKAKSVGTQFSRMLLNILKVVLKFCLNYKLWSLY